MAFRERWFADGWEFTEGSVRDVEYRSGQLGTPGTRGDNGVVPNRPGEIWRPKVHEAGSFTLEVWLGNDQAAAQAAWDTLLRAVARPHRQTEYRRVTPSGESRYCLGEVTGRLEPTAIGQAAYRASIEVTVPAGYWRGEQLFSYSTPTTGAAGTRDVTLPGFALNTAPTTALTYDLAGQLVRPRVTDITQYGKGESLFYDATIADAAGVLLNSADWSMVGRGGHVPNEQALSYTGPGFPSLAALHPATTVHTVRLTADTIGTNGKLTVAGYRSYLV